MKKTREEELKEENKELWKRIHKNMKFVKKVIRKVRQMSKIIYYPYFDEDEICEAIQLAYEQKIRDGRMMKEKELKKFIKEQEYEKHFRKKLWNLIKDFPEDSVDLKDSGNVSDKDVDKGVVSILTIKIKLYGIDA